MNTSNLALKAEEIESQLANHTKTILNTIGIESVFWVDDQFRTRSKDDSHQEQECIKSLMLIFQAAEYDKLNLLVNQTFEKKISVSQDTPEKEVENYFKENVNDDNINTVMDFLGISKDLSQKTFSKLEEVLTKSVNNFSPLSWLEWNEKKSGIQSNENCMFIIDESFKDEPEAANSKGRDIVSSLVNLMPDSSYCFLLTHEVADRTAEEKFRQDIIKTIQNEKAHARFSVVSKTQLNSVDEAALSQNLGQMIKSVYLKKLNVDIFDELRSKMVQRLNELRDDLCQISSFEIEQVIFSSTRKEGSSEVDLLKRFIDIKNNQAMSDCFTDDNTSLINRLSCIRKAQNVKIPSNEKIENIKKFAEYRDLELFDTTVNNLHSPLSVGDIFNFGTETKPKYWILIGQECDLQIRDDYKKRKTSEIYLVPISKKEPLTPEIVQTKARTLTKLKQFTDVLRDFTGHQYHYQIPVLESGTNIDLTFKLNDAVAVNIEILDWCVYNNDGSLRLSTDLNTENLTSLLHLPGWKKKLADDISVITASEDVPAKYECFSFCNDSDFKVSRTQDSLAMKGSRVKRLRAPYKNELVQRFYAYKARNAFDHDFLK